MTVLRTLIEITIYSAVLFGVIWLFRLAFKKHMSPLMLYTVWFLLIARLLMPVTIFAGFSFFVIPAQETAEVQAGSVDLSAMFDENTAAAEPGVPHIAADTAQETAAVPEQPEQAAATSAADAPNVRLDITWEAALIALWLAGAAVMLAVTGASAMRLRHRLKAAHPIPQEWQRTVDEIKGELGIRRDIRIVTIEGFPSPALTAGIRPTVVLPAELMGKSEDMLRFALLHEMTHIRRGDNAVSLLLLILRAVYWFNPIVWLTVHRMHLDMESACDSHLTRPMSPSVKKRYAGTMLSMYAQQQVRYVLGMALGQTKKTAERRLRGMFMRGRSSRRGRIAALLLACVMLVACFTTACQPTPEQEVVMNKNTDLVEDVIAANSAADTSDLEEDKQTIAEQIGAADGHLTMQITPGDQVTIDVDADIVIPEFDQMPMVRVKPENFSQAQFDAFIAYLTGGLPIYYQDRDTTGGIFTQEEIMTILTRIQEFLANKDLPGNIRSPWEYMVGELKKEYDNAMSQADEELYDGTLSVPENEEKEVELDNGIVAVYGSHDTSKSRPA